MNGNSLGYLIKEGLKNIRVNIMMSLASVVVMMICLFLVGAAVLFSANIQSIMKNLQGENVVNIYLKQDTDDITAKNVESQLLALPNISTAVFVSKQEALNQYNEMLGSVFSDVTDEENFLPHAYKITMKDLSLYDETINQIKTINCVETINDKSDTAAKLSSLSNIVNLVSFWVILAFAVISFFIVSNTIRLTMYNRRLEISIMRSVGATNGFIRLPFLVEGVVLGLISSLLSVTILKFVYDAVISSLNAIMAFSSVTFNSVAPLLLSGFVIAGIFFGIFGSMLSITKYLKKEGERILSI